MHDIIDLRSDITSSLAKNEGINLHIDGARIFNPSVAFKRPITDWTKYCDTVMFCFSKGLSCFYKSN